MNTVARRQVVSSGNMMFLLVTCVGVLVAHAVAYMTHEYAHAFTAWSLGWMANPLALDYGPPTLYNVLFLGGVSDNVNYAPILASGQGLAVFTIALAGMLMGNVLLYFLMYRAANTRFVSSRPVLLASTYWLALMCAGNAWGYVPIRGFTTHADIAIAASGLQLPTWVLGLCLLPLSLYVVWHCLCRFLARHVETITRSSLANLTVMVVLSSYWLFAFYGADGTSGDYGLVAQLLSIASRYFLLPLSAMYLFANFRSARFE
jgi:hypothetical protein